MLLSGEMFTQLIYCDETLTLLLSAAWILYTIHNTTDNDILGCIDQIESMIFTSLLFAILIEGKQFLGFQHLTLAVDA